MSSLSNIKNIDDLNIKIDNIDELEKYVEIFSLKKIVINYGLPFIDLSTNRFYSYVKSSEIINLIEFDKNLSSKLLRMILMLEWKLKNIFISEWKNFYKLSDPYIYNYTDEFLLSLIPNINNCNDLVFDKFKYSLFEHAVNSEFLSDYNSLTKIPIDDLVDSWTLATTINFFRVLDNELQKNIVSKFKMPRTIFVHFHKMLNLILKVRNTLSHNYTAYNLSVRHYRIEFNKIFNVLFPHHTSNDGDNIYIDKITSMIGHLLSAKKFEIDISLDLKNLQINPVAKEKVIKLIYGEN